MRLITVAASLIAASIVFSVTGGGTIGSGSPFTFNGTLTLQSYDGYSTGTNGNCYGSGGYDDINESAGVTVSNTKGEVVAVGRLGPGTFSSLYSGCSFAFSVTDVPDGDSFYQIEVSHRGKINTSAEDAKNGSTSLTLG
jgi:hypothetical protein